MMLQVLAFSTVAYAGSPTQESGPTAAMLTGASAPGQWDAGLALGYPWTRARVQRGLDNGWTPFVEVDSALYTRTRPAVGMSLPWIDRRWRVSGEATVGWLEQTGTLAERGPSGSLAMRVGRARGRVLPYLHAGTEHTLIMDRVVTDTADGEVIENVARHAWTLTGAMGVGIALGRGWGLDVGLDLPWVDVPRPSIPGIHLGVQFGGAR